MPTSTLTLSHLPSVAQPSGVAIAHLKAIAHQLVQDSLAPSSQRAYSSAQRSFLQFCHSLQVPALPAHKQVLLLYIAELSQRVAHSTVRSYSLAIRHMHLSNGFPDPLRDRPRLDLALRGIKRRKPPSRDTRLLITPFVLGILERSLTHLSDHYCQFMLWAACCPGFFAFLHSGKFTLPAGVKFDPSRHLSPSDVIVDNLIQPSVLCIHLKSSKTDTMGAGVNLFVGQTYNSLCPVVAMLQYLAVRGFCPSPLFCW